MGTVTVINGLEYNPSQLQRAVYQCLNQSLFSTKLFPGAKVLIKVNLLKKNKPEDAVTTHPLVALAIASYLLEKKCIPIIGDSPAGPFTPSALREIYRATGMLQLDDTPGLILNYNTLTEDVAIETKEGRKVISLMSVTREVDFIISAAKLKTHGMMTFTGAVKNLYGVLPGLTKVGHHFRLAEPVRFAQFLVDLCEYVKPAFSIIDGIEGMESNGPSGGQIRKVGVLIGGDNPYEVDSVACSLISIPEKIVPILYLAKSQGKLADSIDIQGDGYNPDQIPPFLLPDSVQINFFPVWLPASIEKFLMERLKFKPIFVHVDCISCGHCLDSCPAKAIHMDENNKPVLSSPDCISCFCCHEVCPAKAIKIHKPFLSRFFGMK